MKRLFTILILLICLTAGSLFAQPSTAPDSIIPVRGLAIAAPSVSKMDLFLKFIEEELAPGHFNLLILRVDWNYAYESHPELRDPNPLTKQDVKRIVEVCCKHNIQIAPQINLLGHQSWAETTYALLREYPEFDETPHVDTKNYTGWPNPDGLYCKSYCPLHPGVHKVVFALVDELTEAFETTLFHAGMDEVFYIGDDKCPRCSGHDKAELYAGEVTKIQTHLAQQGKRLMIWGDRLIDGKTTGIGAWEASMNNTHRAIDLIPKEVFICDWHYERPEQTAVYFAMKGFDVATCPWRKPDVAIKQLDDMIRFRQHSGQQMANRFQGIIATIWSGADSFLENYYKPENSREEVSEVATVKRLIEAYKMRIPADSESYLLGTFIETAPEFPGGQKELLKFINNEVKKHIPTDSWKEGRVNISCWIDKTGQLIDPEIIRSLTSEQDAIALDIINKIPLWTPGTVRGKPLKVRYVIPISFMNDSLKK